MLAAGPISIRARYSFMQCVCELGQERRLPVHFE